VSSGSRRAVEYRTDNLTTGKEVNQYKLKYLLLAGDMSVFVVGLFLLLFHWRNNPVRILASSMVS
jgi:hypothetical protein